MNSTPDMIVGTLKRLRAAIGYQELGMTQHALRCLDGLALLGKIGPFYLVVAALHDAFEGNRDHRDSPAATLAHLAGTLPTPARHAAQLALIACFGQASNQRAANQKASARGANPEIGSKSA
jgi:hypothetical protein